MTAADDKKTDPDTGFNADVFLEQDRELRKAELEREKAASAARLKRKAAKRAGMPLEAYALHEKLMKMDPEDAVKLLTQALRMGRWRSAPYATQFDLLAPPDVKHNDRPTQKSIEAQLHYDAWEAGQHCGMKGGNKCDNPHQVGSELHVKWDDGFNNGWEFHKAKPEAEQRVRAASGRGRGRPPGSKNKPKAEEAAAAPAAEQAPPATPAPTVAAPATVQ